MQFPGTGTVAWAALLLIGQASRRTHRGADPGQRYR